MATWHHCFSIVKYCPLKSYINNEDFSFGINCLISNTMYKTQHHKISRMHQQLVYFITLAYLSNIKVFFLLNVTLKRLDSCLHTIQAGHFSPCFINWTVVSTLYRLDNCPALYRMDSCPTPYRLDSCPTLYRLDSCLHRQMSPHYTDCTVLYTI